MRGRDRRLSAICEARAGGAEQPDGWWAASKQQGGQTDKPALVLQLYYLTGAWGQHQHAATTSLITSYFPDQEQQI